LVIYSALRPERTLTVPAVPKYVRVADAIRDQIRAGKLKPGDQLPSLAKLCEEYRVSYSSIRSAMLTLKAERLIDGVPGVGVYVLPGATERAAG
jgi:GntR family transcriptional regulator